MKKGIKLFLLSGLAAFSLTCAMSCSNPTNPEKPGTEGESGTNPGENQKPGGGDETTPDPTESEKIKAAKEFVSGTKFVEAAAAGSGAVDTYEFAEGKDTFTIAFNGRTDKVPCTYTFKEDGETLKATVHFDASKMAGDSTSDAMKAVLEANPDILYTVSTEGDKLALTDGKKPDGKDLTTPSNVDRAGEVVTKLKTGMTLYKYDTATETALKGKKFIDGDSSKYVIDADRKTITMTLAGDADKSYKYAYTLGVDKDGKKLITLASESGYYKAPSAEKESTAKVKLVFEYASATSDPLYTLTLKEASSDKVAEANGELKLDNDANTKYCQKEIKLNADGTAASNS